MDSYKKEVTKSIKIIEIILLGFAIFFFISAYILEGLVNKIGFTTVGLYTLYIMFKPGKTTKGGN